MCKSLQFVICTSTFMLHPWLTNIRNVTNATYFLAQSIPNISHNSQIIYYNTNRTMAQNSDCKIQAFKLKLSKNSLAHSLSVSTYSNHWNEFKLEMQKWVKQGKSKESELKN